LEIRRREIWRSRIRGIAICVLEIKRDKAACPLIFQLDGRASGGTNVRNFLTASNELILWFSLPHITQDLYVTCNLLLGTRDIMFLEVIDKELVPPTTPAAGLGICSIWRIPIFTETLDEYFLY
jgi:hypothetical protein